jgi:hypothetical protein
MGSEDSQWLLTLRDHLDSPRFVVGSVMFIFWVFCIVLYFYVCLFVFVLCLVCPMLPLSLAIFTTHSTYWKSEPSLFNKIYWNIILYRRILSRLDSNLNGKYAFCGFHELFLKFTHIKKQTSNRKNLTAKILRDLLQICICYRFYTPIKLQKNAFNSYNYIIITFKSRQNSA